jgi:O-antigen/teichoic acid export membrane protein
MTMARGSRRGLSSGAAFLIATLVANGANYLFHVAVSRSLGPSEYGALASLLAVVLVLAVPSGVLQAVVSAKTSALRAAGRADEVPETATGILKALAPIALLAGLVLLAAGTPAFAVFLHVSWPSAALLAPFTVIALLGSVAGGALQGTLRFTAISGLILLAVGMRLLFGVGLVWAGLGVAGALAGTVLAALIGVCMTLRILGVGRASLRAARGALGHLRGDFVTTLLGLTGFWVLAEIDLALARHYLPHQEAGFYSSAGLLSRAPLFLATAIAVFAFPRFVSARQLGEGALQLLRRALLATTAVVVLAAPLLIFLRDPLVSIAFGGKYGPAAAIVPVLVGATAFLSIAAVLTYFHIAMGSRGYVLTFTAIVLETIVIAFRHGSAQEIGVVVLCVSAVASLLLYRSAVSLVRWRPPLESAEAAEGLPGVEVSVVLPCYNAAGGLRNVLTSLADDLDETGSYEIIVVSDGSTDATVEIARGLEDRSVRVIEQPAQGGKGLALRAGLTEARGEYVAFVDADGDVDPHAIRPFLALMRLYEPDIILGSKRHPLSDVYYPPLRRLLSWVYHKLTRILFRVNVRDTQTGLKLIRRDVLAAVLPRLYEKRYAFDLELLVAARAAGFKRVFEAPVRIRYSFDSAVSPRSALQILIDTGAILYRHHLLGAYRGAGRPVSATGLPVRRTAVSSGHLRLLIADRLDIGNPEAGPAERQTHAIAKRWRELGHEVTILAAAFRGGAARETIDGVRVRRLGSLRTGSYAAFVQREAWRRGSYDAIVAADMPGRRVRRLGASAVGLVRSSGRLTAIVDGVPVPLPESPESAADELLAAVRAFALFPGAEVAVQPPVLPAALLETP